MRVLLLLAIVGCGSDGRPNGTKDKGDPTTGTPTGTVEVGPFEFVVDPQIVLAKPLSGPLQIANIRRVSLDWGPGLEVVHSQATPPALTWVGCEGGACMSEALPIGPDVVPVRTATADLDADGDTDLILASIGSLGPSNALVGSLWIYWRDGTALTPELIEGGLPRLVCAEPGDLDQDGDLDLTLCLFGHTQVGEVAWMEQAPTGWVRHTIDPRPGAIHAFPADMDGDGDLDIMVGMAQLDEELVLYRNDGSGNFTIETVFDRSDTWFGLSGIELVDLDQDGDLDVLLTNGDTLDSDLPDGTDPNALHGLRWFDNDGTAQFTEHLIFNSWGCYTVRAADLDGDDDLDILLGNFQSTRNLQDWDKPAELWALENDGNQGFTPHEVMGAPPQLISIEVGDTDQDGDIDVFAGSMGVDGTQDKERLVLLRNISYE